jgi:YggT family protein
MFVLANFLSALAQLLQMVFQVYTLILIVRVLITWVNPDPFNPVVQFLSRVTDPVLEPLRRVIPPLGPIDISPIIALLLLQALQHFIVRTLWDFSVRLH